MNDMLSIGLNGVRAYQASLSTTSENIANAGTVGYSRRTTAVREIVATGGMTSAQATGLGVAANGVVRAADEFRAAEVRNAASDLSRSNTSINWMARIETALSGNMLADRITAFFNSATTLAGAPTSVAARSAMLESASTVASAFAATGQALDASARALDTSVHSSVTRLNDLSAGLAKVNSGLGRTQPGTAGAAALLDERDRLLQEMSGIIDINSSIDEFGRVSVTSGGQNGSVLVHGDNASFVAYAREGGAAVFSVHRSSGVSVLAPTAGALSGAVESAQRIHDATLEIESQARGFAEGVNAAQAQGFDLDGNPGAPLFEIGEPATQLKVVLTDPRNIAASGIEGAERDSSNLAKLQELRLSGGFEDKVNQLTTTNAASLSARRGVAEAQTAMYDAAALARDSVSGVNIDEEAVELLRFQQAYQASSRVIQVAREMLNSIMEIR